MMRKFLRQLPDPWFSGPDALMAVEINSASAPSREEVEALRSKYETVYREHVEAFTVYQRKHNRADAYFAETMKQATMGDRMVSQAIEIRDNPFFR